MTEILKIWFWNAGGFLERLTCDCGCEEFVDIAISDEDGDAFECSGCSGYSRQLMEYRSEKHGR